MTPLAILAELDVRDLVEPLTRICAVHGVEPLRVLDRGGDARARAARRAWYAFLVGPCPDGHGLSESAAARLVGRHASTVHKVLACRETAL